MTSKNNKDPLKCEALIRDLVAHQCVAQSLMNWLLKIVNMSGNSFFNSILSKEVQTHHPLQKWKIPLKLNSQTIFLTILTIFFCYNQFDYWKHTYWKIIWVGNFRRSSCENDLIHRILLQLTSKFFYFFIKSSFLYLLFSRCTTACIDSFIYQTFVRKTEFHTRTSHCFGCSIMERFVKF